MSRSQKYISVLLERLPKSEIRSYEHQTSFDRLRDRISSTPNLQEELEALYRVKGFSDFALSLLWIAGKVDKDPTLEVSTPDEETLVFSKFKQAVSDVPATVHESAPSSSTFELPISPGIETTQMMTPEPESGSMMDDASQRSETVQTNFGEGVLGREQEHSFSQLLERFLEAVQSGNDDRTTLTSEVIQECNSVVSASVGEDYRQFCQLLVEFLQYITDNQYLDDVRVMNIVSNVQDPFSQWARSEPENRAGVLDQAIDILRDFKTMFE